MTNFEQNIFDLGRDVQKFHPSYTVLLQVVHLPQPTLKFYYFASLNDTQNYLLSQKKPEDKVSFNREDLSLGFQDYYIKFFDQGKYQLVVQRLEETLNPPEKVIPKSCQTEVCDLNLPPKNSPKSPPKNVKKIVKTSSTKSLEMK